MIDQREEVLGVCTGCRGGMPQGRTRQAAAARTSRKVTAEDLQECHLAVCGLGAFEVACRLPANKAKWHPVKLPPKCAQPAPRNPASGVATGHNLMQNVCRWQLH